MWGKRTHATPSAKAWLAEVAPCLTSHITSGCPHSGLMASTMPSGPVTAYLISNDCCWDHHFRRREISIRRSLHSIISQHGARTTPFSVDLLVASESPQPHLLSFRNLFLTLPFLTFRLRMGYCVPPRRWNIPVRPQWTGQERGYNRCWFRRCFGCVLRRPLQTSMQQGQHHCLRAF